MRRQLGVRTMVASALLLLSGSAFAGDPADERVVDQDPSAFPPAGTSGRLFLTGAAVTAGWYGAAVGTSYLWTNSLGAHVLRIPVVGPPLALAKTGCGHHESCDPFKIVLRSIFTTLSAVGQVGGLVVMGEALFLPTRSDDTHSELHLQHLEREPAAPTPLASVRAFPLVTEEGALGIGVTGVF